MNTEPPEAPTSLEVTERKSRQVQINWKTPFAGNSAITAYLIEFRILNAGDGSNTIGNWSNQRHVPTTHASRHSTVVSTLQPDREYELRISAMNQVGVGPASSSVHFRSGEEPPAGPPLQLHIEPSGSTSLKVRWKAPRVDLRNGQIRGYYIGYRLLSGIASQDHQHSFNYKNVELIANQTTIDAVVHTYLSNLQRKSQYAVVVQAYNLAGAGPRSDEIRQTTLDAAPPITPRLEVTASGASWLQLIWYAPSSSSSSQPMTDAAKISSSLAVPPPEPADYTVYYRLEAESQFHRRSIPAQITTSSTSTSASLALSSMALGEYRLEGLRCGNRYELYMTASNSLGSGEPSERLLSRTAGAAPVSPAAGQSFIVRNYSALTLQLHLWKTGGCPIRSFSIQYRPNITASVETNGASETSAPLVMTPTRWTVIKKELSGSSRLLNRELLLQLPHLTSNTWYQLLVAAKSDAGTTEEEYLVRTLNRSELDANNAWMVGGVMTTYDASNTPEMLPDMPNSGPGGYQMSGNVPNVGGTNGNGGSSYELLDSSSNSLLAVQQLAVLAPLLATGVLLALIGALGVLCVRRQVGLSAGMIGLQRLPAMATATDTSANSLSHKIPAKSLGNAGATLMPPEQYTLSDYQRMQMASDAAAVDALYGKLFAAAAAAACPLTMPAAQTNGNTTMVGLSGSVSTGQLLDDNRHAMLDQDVCKTNQINDGRMLTCGAYYSSPLRKYPTLGCAANAISCGELLSGTNATMNMSGGVGTCTAPNCAGPHDYAEPYTQRCLLDLDVIPTPPPPPPPTSTGTNALLSTTTITTGPTSCSDDTSANATAGSAQVRMIRFPSKNNEQMYATIKRGNARNPANFVGSTAAHI